jgi:hypothetical protein
MWDVEQERISLSTTGEDDTKIIDFGLNARTSVISRPKATFKQSAASLFVETRSSRVGSAEKQMEVSRPMSGSVSRIRRVSIQPIQNYLKQQGFHPTIRQVGEK